MAEHPIPSSPTRAVPPPLALTRRAVFLGFLLVIFVAAFTPYNDYVLHNSPFIGNHFPIGIITLAALLILIVNPFLMLIRRTPFATGELIVILTMMLVAAAVPSSGLMRYLEPLILSPYWKARDRYGLEAIADLMPSWLLPSRNANSPITIGYWLGIDRRHGEQIPIVPFLLPQLLWGILIAAILGSALFLAAIFRRQWVHHERLTFPLATIPLELMAAPEEGRWYNKLWRSHILWAGVALPAFIYLLAGINSQYPRMPFINLHYDFQDSFRERPWNALPPTMQSSTLYLAVVGICFFIPSEIAFSMWLFVLLDGLAAVFLVRSAIELTNPEKHQIAMGTYITYFAGLLWIARGHLRLVLTSAWRGSPRADGEPLSYRSMVVGWVLCIATAWAWLIAVGVNPFAAALLLLLGTMLVTLMARIVAETGLFFVGPIWWPRDFVAALLGPKLINTLSFYWTQILSALFFGDLRETLMPFAVNSLRMGQELPHNERPPWFRRLFAALLLSILVSGAVHHYLSYTRGRTAIEDNYASDVVPSQVLRDTSAFATSTDTQYTQAWTRLAIGAVLVTLLMVGRATWAAWPFHPIGLVLMGSGPMQQVWFSIFIGWGIKRLLLRYGGAMFFRRARPFFIGLILGEILSAGLWMFIGLISGGTVRFTLLPQ